MNETETFYSDCNETIDRVGEMVRGSVKKKPKKPPWVDELEVVYNFGIAKLVTWLTKKEQDKEPSNENPYVVKLHRDSLNTETKNWSSVTIGINKVEDWEEIKEIIEVKWAKQLGWISEEEALKILKKEAKKTTVKEVIDKRPSLLIDVLDESDIKKLDSNQLASLVESLSNKKRSIMDRYLEFFNNIVETANKKDEKSIESLSEILDKISLAGIATTMDFITYRISRINTFEELITKPGAYESKTKGQDSIHKLLEENIWLLGEEYNILSSDTTLKKSIGQDLAKEDKDYELKRPDFVCNTFENQLVIVEIKRPSVKLERKQLNKLHRIKEIADKYFSPKIEKSQAYLIVNSIQPDLRATVKDFKKMDIIVKPYREVISEVKNRYKHLLKIYENEYRDKFKA